MTQPPEGFEKVGHGERRLFGPAGLLACGFSPEEQQRLEGLIADLGLELPCIFAGAAERGQAIEQLFALPAGHGRGGEVELPRALVVGGISEGELQRLMAGYRELGWPRPLWAALTPVSVGWTLERLLAALAEEDAAFGRG